MPLSVRKLLPRSKGHGFLKLPSSIHALELSESDNVLVEMELFIVLVNLVYHFESLHIDSELFLL